MSNFQTGQRVRLKSGGPLMTVEFIEDDGEIICTWFDKDQKRQRETFPAATLDEHKPSSI